MWGAEFARTSVATVAASRAAGEGERRAAVQVVRWSRGAWPMDKTPSMNAFLS